MFQSMTGYGKASVVTGDRKIEVEIRSLNSRQLDLNLRLPSAYRALEGDIRNIVNELLLRGKVDLSIVVNAGDRTGKPPVNKELAKQYYRQIKEIGKAIGEKKISYLPLIMNLPGIFNPDVTASKEELKTVVSLVKRTTGLVTKYRTEEGKALKKDVDSHLSVIVKKESELTQLDPARTERIRNKLLEKLEEIKNAGNLDKNRFEQELIYYMEKLDINEERTRLRTHCHYFMETINESNCGRKLGFIAQEIGREINTIGSKANDAGIQKLVVEMKDELEKIKEQLLNVL